MTHRNMQRIKFLFKKKEIARSNGEISASHKLLVDCEVMIIGDGG